MLQLDVLKNITHRNNISHVVLCRVKQKGLNFSPDVVSLNAAKQRVRQVSQSRKSRTMKEKLIHQGEGLNEVDINGSAGVPGLQPDGSPAVTCHRLETNDVTTLGHVTVELNNDCAPGLSLPNGETSNFRQSYGGSSTVSEAVSEPSTPGAQSGNDIRLREVKAQVV